MIARLLRLVGIPAPLPLLSARIVADEHHRYHVFFAEHHSQLQKLEFVRLVLHYYAKMLYNLSPSDPAMFESAQVLQTTMRSVVKAGLSDGSDVLALAGIQDVAALVTYIPTEDPRELTAMLYFTTVTRRHIKTWFPRNAYAQHLVFSVFVLLQAALKHTDAECIAVMARSLRIMNERYESGVSFSKLSNLASIPNGAYLAAILE